MVRVVRMPGIAKSLFTSNQLSGWPNGVAYSTGPTPLPLKPRRKRKSRSTTSYTPHPAQHCDTGDPTDV